MTMRVSTAGMHAATLGLLLDAQARLARTQEQIASGKRINSPADDPIGATRIEALTRQIEAGRQYTRNADAAANRLKFEEQALSDLGSALNRVRELVLQAGNATVDPASRAMIRAEVAGRVQEMLDIANRQDGQGEYLFAGLASQTRPFERTDAGVVYRGDQGQRFQAVGATQRVADGDSGDVVFGRVPGGNGTFVTGPAAGNAGTGVIGVGSVLDPSAWPGGTFTLRFVAANAWEVVDSATPVPNVVASGAYASGQAIEFAGISVEVSGEPVAGDSFTVADAGRVGFFAALDELVATLGSSTATPAGRAQFQSRIAGGLAQLDQSIEHLQRVRAGVGVRLGTLENAVSAQEDLEIDLQSLLSSVRDLDYAEAVSRLNQQYVALQAAQQSLARVGQLSLFDYL
jgi:flagellar hook-associated protein 3 FlgL